MTSEEDNQSIDLSPVDLPAPPGWSKKYFPKLIGTPSRKDIVFTSPTGEEIKNKSQLEKYLKSHPGGPAVSEFDWDTGYSPRRSSRYSDSPKGLSRLSKESKGDDATVSSLSPMKRQKKSSRMGAEEKSNADAEEGTTGEKDAAAVEAKETVEGSSERQKSKGDDLTFSSPSPKKRQKKSSRMGAQKKSNAAAEEAVEGSSADAKDGVDEDVSPGKPMSEDGENKSDTEVASEEPVIKTEPLADIYSPIRKVDESKEASPAEELNASVGEPVNATDGTPESPLQEAYEDIYSPIRKANEASPVVPDTKNDKASNDGKETPDGNAVTESDGDEHSKEKEAEGKAATVPSADLRHYPDSTFKSSITS